MGKTSSVIVLILEVHSCHLIVSQNTNHALRLALHNSEASER